MLVSEKNDQELPLCKRIAIQHFSKNGESHLAFFDDDKTIKCVRITSLEDGCCNMLGESMETSCRLTEVIKPKHANGHDKDTVKTESSFERNYSETPIAGVSLCNNDAELEILWATGTEEYLEKVNMNRVSSRCTDMIEKKCNEALCGLKFTETSISSQGNSFILPSLCTGRWEKVFKSADYLLDSIFPKQKGVESNVKLSTIAIPDMCCSMEAELTRKCLLGLPGLISVAISVPLKRANVRHNPDVLSVDFMISKLADSGLDCHLVKKYEQEVMNQTSQGKTKKLINEAGEENNAQKFSSKINPPVLVAVVFLCISLLEYFPNMSYFKYSALVSFGLCCPSIIRKSFKRLRNGTLEVTTLMSIASIGAILLGDYAEGAAVITLYSLSSWLESIATSRIKSAVDDIVRLQPKTARKVIDGMVSVVHVDELEIGDFLEVRVGDTIAADSIVFKGETSIDESALTGEPRSVLKQVGDEVLAGTINVGKGFILVKVSMSPSNSVVSRILALVEEATANKSETEQFVERVASIYTPFIFTVALLLATTPFFWGADIGAIYLKNALVLLVIGCPCALVISTPITYIAGLAEAAKKGILIKGGTHLENLANLNILCFDKTGTVTEGKFSIQTYLSNENIKLKKATDEEISVITNEREMLRAVSKIEATSNHPIALALSKYIPELITVEEPVRERNSVLINGELFVEGNVEVDKIDTIKGKGISAQVYKVFTNKVYLEEIKETADNSTPTCEDKCCNKTGRVNIREDLFTWIENEIVNIQNYNNFASIGENKAVSDESVSYMIRVLDEDFNEEDANVVQNALNTALSEDILVEIFATYLRDIIVLRCTKQLDVKLILQKFMVCGLEIKLLKIKFEHEVFFGSLRLAKEYRRSFVSDDFFIQGIENYENNGSSICIFGSKKSALCAFFVGDEIRPTASTLIENLHRINIDTFVLTGDNERSAEIVCREVGISKFYANLLPEDKESILRNLREEDKETEILQDTDMLPLISKKNESNRHKKTIGMIGDGINDALCLATADVSFSLGDSGTSLAIETADITLVDGNLMKVYQAIVLGKLTLKKIKQNITFSVLTKILVLSVTFLGGISSLWLAILSDIGAMLAVTLNSISIMSRS